MLGGSIPHTPKAPHKEPWSYTVQRLLQVSKKHGPVGQTVRRACALLQGQDENYIAAPESEI